MYPAFWLSLAEKIEINDDFMVLLQGPRLFPLFVKVMKGVRDNEPDIDVYG